ncbi:hypothetical protein D3C71_721940 [compost metagenome]
MFGLAPEPAGIAIGLPIIGQLIDHQPGLPVPVADGKAGQYPDCLVNLGAGWLDFPAAGKSPVACKQPAPLVVMTRVDKTGVGMTHQQRVVEKLAQ